MLEGRSEVMHLSSFSIQNYKSYWDTGKIDLTPGFNAIVGQNNVGKTALVQALSLTVANAPHRSTRTIPQPSVNFTEQSRLTFQLQISREELLELIPALSSQFYVLPLRDGSIQDAFRQIDRIFSGSEQFLLDFSYQAGGLTDFSFLGSSLRLQSQTIRSIPLTLDKGKKLHLAAEHFLTVREEALLGRQLIDIFLARKYIFQAERPNIGPSSIEPGLDLTPNASNLAQVLHYFRNSNESGFERYRNAVRLVLPQVKQITTVPIGGSQTQVYVWHIDPSSERYDLAVTLPESGTGIGQVLALLYVILVSRTPQVIIIDEPQSFLHPGAVRKLFEVMQQYPQHQYIITTHSPTAITAANPTTLLMVRKDSEESTIERIDTTQLADLRRYLAEIGARLSDVFGYDNILWVEGPTEESAFPEIVRRFRERQLSGTAILGVLAVGDFERRDAERTWDIYSKLCMGNALLPPARGFIFDREDRDEATQGRFIDRSGGLVAFTTRRMYENYLLNSRAIAELMNRQDNFRELPVTSEEIDAWIEEHRWEKSYINPPIDPAQQNEEVWLREVHGGKVLEALFKHFSRGTYTYLDYKVTYGTELTGWLIDNAPDDLAEIATLILQKIDQ